MIETSQIKISGMHCAACAVRIEKVVSKVEGVTSVQVNLATEKGRVTYNKKKTTLPEVLHKINQIGFTAKEMKEADDDLKFSHHELRSLQWKVLLSVMLTIPLAWAMVAHVAPPSSLYIPPLFLEPLFQLMITIPIQFVIGLPFYERAFAALKNRSANMDVLVVLSTSAAFFYSHYLTMTAYKTGTTLHSNELFYETSAFIITFVLLGKLLETKTKRKTTEAIKKLYELQTKTATLYINGEQKKIEVAQLLRGDLILIKPGERIPIDGQVISGSSLVDEALLTGESTPIEKNSGSLAFAGTVNQHGHLLMKVMSSDSDTMLSQIIQVVEEAQTMKAPVQYLADRVTGVFVPFVIIIALATFSLWYVYLQPGNSYEALEKLITVLIIACPCALGLATPTSVTVGSGRAAQLGILFKEGKYLEILGKTDICILDKTGTITKGEPTVTDIYIEGTSEHQFLKQIGAVEQASGHPLGKAILKVVQEKLLHLPLAQEVTSVPGYGVKGIVDEREIIIASPVYFAKNKLLLPKKANQIVQAFEQEGKTVMIATVDSRFSGVIATADEWKPTSKGAIARMKKMGIDVMMLTGDHQTIAKTIAKKMDINTYYAEVTPQQKAAFIEKLQRKGRHVTMVGDGINDAPALTRSDVGIALGTGSDIAIDSGDVTIMTGNLHRVADAITISKKTMRNIKQNLLWAFLYNLIMIPFAIIGILAPWLAGAVMAFSSVTVVLNALRLRRMRVGE